MTTVFLLNVRLSPFNNGTTFVCFLRVNGKYFNIINGIPLPDTNNSRFCALTKKDNINPKRKTFVEGFVVSSLIACVGPIAILAPLNEVISKDLNLMFIKTGLDGIMVFVYSGTMGIGVLFSSLSVLLVQGFFTFLSLIIGNTFLNEEMIKELTSTGGLMILSIGFRLLNIKKIPSADLIPGLIFAPLIVFTISQF